MWTESKKWSETRAGGGHGVVRFDVFCSHCGKQIGDDVGADDISKCGLVTDKPIEVFCGCKCAKDYQKEKEKGVRLMNYGWTPAIFGS